MKNSQINTHFFRPPFAIFILAIFVLFDLVACKSAQRKPDESEYSFSARTRFEEAEDSLDGGYYTEAVKQFNEVKTQFPFSQFAILAELKIADTYFEQEDYTQAIDGYKQFVTLHPNHEEVPYALYRIGLSYYEQSPHEWPLFPPACENDQTPTRNAVAAFRRYSGRFPEHKFAGDAKSKIAECQKMLADSELSVAEFYINQEQYKAAIGRLEYFRKEYPDAANFGSAMLLLADLYLKDGQRKEADGVLSDIIAAAADKDSVQKAKELQQKLSIGGS